MRGMKITEVDFATACDSMAMEGRAIFFVNDSSYRTISHPATRTRRCLGMGQSPFFKENLNRFVLWGSMAISYFFTQDYSWNSFFV